MKMRTATFTVVGLAGAALAHHGLTASPLVVLAIVLAILGSGFVMSWRRA
jgi:hypothetical protein